MSRAKLEELGIDLPLFPVTAVGSYPKPRSLKVARSRFGRGQASAEELQRATDEALEFWIREQERIGLDVLVHGEMERGDMVAYFADEMDGFERGGLVRSYGNRYYHKPIIVGEVRWRRPMTVDTWRRAQALTDRPVKGMLTGPYTMMDWSFVDYYRNRREAALALAREIRNEVEALVEAGCRIVQIDEPATSVRPSEIELVAEVGHVVTDGLPAYFINHICYGRFAPVYPALLELPVDNFDMEASNSRMDLLDLFGGEPPRRDITVGVVDSHSHVVETPEQVMERARAARAVLPDEAIWLDPDCGLKTRTVEESVAKLEAIVAVARELRAAG